MMVNRTLTKLVRRATLAGAAIVAIGVTGGGLNQSPAAIPDDPFAGLVPMTEAMLASRRGGISAPAVPFGLNINLGGNLTATIDGTVVLETVFTITDTVITAHTLPNVTLPNFGGLPVTFIESGASGITVTASVTDSVTVDGGQVVTVSGSQISVPEGFAGVASVGTEGVVAVLQKISQDQIVNLAVSTDTGRTVTQDLELVIEVANFGNVQGGQAFSNLAQTVSQDVRNAILGTLKN